MPLQATSGAASYDAFGGGVAAVPNYIEDVFSTWLYTGNGSTNTITNNIDLSTKGGLVWMKSRSDATYHGLYDTVRGTGTGKSLYSNTTEAQGTNSLYQNLTAFNTTGFTLGSTSSTNVINGSGSSYVSWTFRKQPKFFDVVTVSHTNGVADTVDLSGLGTVGCVIVKCTSALDDWYVWHRGCSAGNIIRLNLTDAQYSSTKLSVSGTTLTISSVFATGTYIVYAYAHNAGGFGLTGTDNVISCGSFTKSGSSDVTVNLGYEPQWILAKSSTNAQNWFIFDTMRGMSWSAGADYLNPNTSSAETPSGPTFLLSATGFTLQGFIADASYIYIAIRRGPMKVPTDATKVFAPVTYTGNATTRTLTTNFPVDLNTSFYRPGYAGNTYFYDRLRGVAELLSSSTAAEGSTGGFGFASNVGITLGTSAFNGSGETYINYMMQRAPSFFDEVCYTGTGSATTVTHNLGVVPEMMIVKCRSTGGTNRGWWTYVAPLGNTQALYLNGQDNAQTAGIWNNTTPTSTVFSIDGTYLVNGSGATYVAYLFATLAGVSKVGSYTGNGTTQTIDCGFTGGARFVLIKRTDSTGDWYVWDSARGMVSGTDPSLLLNSTAAEVNANSIYTVSTGFQIVSTAAGINASGGSYIFLSVA
jgi:hypothetical protein